MHILGNIIAVLIIGLTAWALGTCLIPSVRKTSKKNRELSGAILFSAAMLSLLALVVLVLAFVTYDFRLEYVQKMVDRQMQISYLLTAVWGGQEGSLLFWASLQSILAFAVHRFGFVRLPRLAAVATAVMAAISLFFWITLLFASNPFIAADNDPVNSIGMNPLLRNPFMVLHPPTLFFGFAGFSVPFAFAVAALAVDEVRSNWLYCIRPFILGAFVFLTVGNLLGMVWAYQELGWGGYWGWDPVENASLMPWITGAALLHSAIAENRRQSMRFWSVSLVLFTFVLIIFGTFLTRSAIVQSVHTFADSKTGPFFVGLISVVFIGYFYLMFKRKESLRGDVIIPVWSWTREWVLVLVTWLLTIAVLFVFIATLWPAISQLIQGDQVSVSSTFFNRMMVPVGLVFLVLLLIGVRINWQKQAQPSIGPLIGGTVASIGGGVWYGAWHGVRDFTLFQLAPVISIALCAGALVTTLSVFLTGLTKRSRWKNGAHLAHLGLVILFIGFSGAGMVSESTVTVRPGDYFYFNQSKVVYMGPRFDSNARRDAIYADLVYTEFGHEPQIVAPARYFFHSHPQMPTSEVDIVTTMTKDTFFALGSFDPKNGQTSLKVIENPLVFFVWLGGALLLVALILSAIRQEAVSDCIQWILDASRSTRLAVSVVAVGGIGAFAFFPLSAALTLLGGFIVVCAVFGALQLWSKGMERGRGPGGESAEGENTNG